MRKCFVNIKTVKPAIKGNHRDKKTTTNTLLSAANLTKEKGNMFSFQNMDALNQLNIFLKFT